MKQGIFLRNAWALALALVLASFVAGGAFATPNPNGALLETRIFDDCPLSDLNTINNVKFGVADLFKMTPESLAELGAFDKWLVDPPRDGAFELVKAITPETSPARIVYVSCNPATLARDAGVLLHEKDYRLSAAGVINMFPHTAHVESIALFEKL